MRPCVFCILACQLRDLSIKYLFYLDMRHLLHIDERKVSVIYEIKVIEL